MPTVPRYDNPQVSPNTAQLPRTGGAPLVAPIYTPQGQTLDRNPDAGKQLHQLGTGLMSLGDAGARIVTDMQTEQSKTEAKAQDVAFTSKLNVLMHDPDTGALSQQGRNAIDGYKGTVEAIDKLRRDSLGQMKDPMAAKMANEVFTHRSEVALSQLASHTAAQNQSWKVQTSQARAEVSLRDAAASYSDPITFALSMGTAANEAEEQGRIQGWDAATTAAQRQRYSDDGFKLRYDAWRIKDPVGAFANFQQNAEQISPLVRQQIGQQLFQHAAPVIAKIVNQAGGVGLVAPDSSEGDGQLPRGIRNNNPGNIVRGPTTWQGEAPGNDPKYATFASPEAGIRAMGKTLLAYQDKHGLNTVEGIVSRWAPATENDTGAYTNTVAKALGVKPDAAIDLHDSDTLARITKAMIKVENGPDASRITDEQIALGLSAANGGALPARSPTVQRSTSEATGYPMLDALPADWKLHVLQLAQADAHRGMAEARDALRGKVQDATAEYMANGTASSPPNEADFIRAYGQNEGVGHFRNFQNTAALGQTLQQVKTLPTPALVEMLNTSKPAPSPGFATAQHNYEILTRAVDQVHQARVKDPVDYALTAGSYGIKPIQRFNIPQDFATELSRRAVAAPSIAADYGTAPQLLTKSEAKALSATIKAAPVEDQKKQLAAIFTGVDNMGLFKQLMQQIAPDNPIAAVAGIYQARGLTTTQSQDVADLILRGQAILTPNTKTDGSNHEGGKTLIKMPEEKLMLSDWNSVTGDAFRGKEQASDLFQQTAKAIYAARSAEEGDYSGQINSKRWKSAIMLATGGIESHNGSKVVMPYGLGYDQFQNALKAASESIVKSGGALNTTPSEMMRLPVENIGDGRYMFRRGAGYLVNKDGRPVIADLNGGR